MKKHMKILAVLLAVCTVCAVLFSSAFAVGHLLSHRGQHGLESAFCPGCGYITHVSSTLKQLGAAVLLVAACLAAMFGAYLFEGLNRRYARAHTPVALKVQLNN